MRRLLPLLFTHNFPLAKVGARWLARLSKLNVNIYFYLHLATDCMLASVCVCVR